MEKPVFYMDMESLPYFLWSDVYFCDNSSHEAVTKKLKAVIGDDLEFSGNGWYTVSHKDEVSYIEVTEPEDARYCLISFYHYEVDPRDVEVKPNPAMFLKGYANKPE